MPRKPSKKSLTARLDRLWSLSVRERAGWRCERCARQGSPPRSGEGGYVLHAHHAVGRANRTLRFDVRNGVSLCYSCHQWAETNPLGFADWFRELRPEDAEYVLERERVITRRSVRDLEDLLAAGL